ncbi:hypothetical protein PM082_009861 [Marasmius tenuissimus]|nr:hypothetical protein PM082_009861 [Marasmius tenuissimus]
MSQQQDLDLVLISHLAQNDSDGRRRHEIALFQQLAEEHRGGITARLWQRMYTQKSEYFDVKVDEQLQLKEKNTCRDDLPITQEDEKLLVAYLAENGGSWNIRRSLQSKLHYKKAAENLDGQTPWGMKRSTDGWYRHFHDNWDRLFRMVLECRKETRASQVGHYPRKWRPEEDELLVSYLAEKKAEGANLCGLVIYRELVENKDGKWPWAAVRTQVAWRARYVDTARDVLKPRVEAKHAELLAAPSSSSLSEPTATVTKLYPSSPVDPHSSTRRAPERVGPSKSGSRPPAFISATPSASSTVRTEDLLTAVTNDIPRHGLFSPQDDAVLLQYLIGLTSNSTIDCTRKRTRSVTRSSSNSETDMFHHLLETVPDARKHTAQTWRKHYQRLKSHFDRLVEHFGQITIRGEGELDSELEEECRPSKRRKLDGPTTTLRESVEDDELELGDWTCGLPETTFHCEKSHDSSEVGDLDSTDEELVEELEVERSLYLDD